jgi:hypothetical protein
MRKTQGTVVEAASGAVGSPSVNQPARLSQMSLGERYTGPGFQVAFEGDGAPLVGKFNHDVNGPRAILNGMDTTAPIVLGESPGDVRGEPGVIARRKFVVPQHVHEPLLHEGAVCRRKADNWRCQ